MSWNGYAGNCARYACWVTDIPCNEQCNGCKKQGQPKLSDLADPPMPTLMQGAYCIAYAVVVHAPDECGDTTSLVVWFADGQAIVV